MSGSLAGSLLKILQVPMTTLSPSGHILSDERLATLRDLSESEGNVVVNVSEQRCKGIVKWFNNQKGYGFIGRDDGADVFVHYSAVLTDGYRSLTEGDQVEFEVEDGPNGRPQASKVVKIA